MSNEWPKITADTSLEEIREIHQRIWNYVVATGTKPYTPYINDCALCEYATLICSRSDRIGATYCDFCPAIWDMNEPCTRCYNNGAAYSKWFPVDHPLHTDDCIEAARRIHDIPFKRKEE